MVNKREIRRWLRNGNEKDIRKLIPGDKVSFQVFDEDGIGEAVIEYEPQESVGEY